MKASPKFKEGDRVVVVDAESTSAPLEMNGKSYIVRACREDSKFHYCELIDGNYGIYEHGLEHDYVYGSPLWQELL